MLELGLEISSAVVAVAAAPVLLRARRRRRYRDCVRSIERLERELFPDWFTPAVEPLLPRALALKRDLDAAFFARRGLLGSGNFVQVQREAYRLAEDAEDVELSPELSPD